MDIHYRCYRSLGYKVMNPRAQVRCIISRDTGPYSSERWNCKLQNNVPFIGLAII